MEAVDSSLKANIFTPGMVHLKLLLAGPTLRKLKSLHCNTLDQAIHFKTNRLFDDGVSF